jgi:enediyne biosynthesis protein E4
MRGHRAFPAGLPGAWVIWGLVASASVACSTEGASPPGPTDGGPTDVGPPDAGPDVGVCASDGVLCDDKDPCTEGDRCRDGICAGTPKACPGEGSCIVGVCDPETGACGTEPVDDGTACDDGNLCTRTDTCREGTCVGADPLECEAGTSCVVGECDPETGECVGTELEDGTACDNPCVRDGRCREGECRGIPVFCAAPACQTGGTCDPVVGCRFTPKPDGEPCSDQDICTTGDVCQDGECVGVPAICGAEDPCQVAFCDSQTGCGTTPLEDGTACEFPDDLCVKSAECQAGRCTPTDVVVCEQKACMVSNQCDPDLGLCMPTFEEDGARCDDGNLCTEDGTCQDRNCRGGAPIPWTGTPCSDGVCFTDVTQAAGITFDAGKKYIFGHAASGAFADFDQDGDLDLLVGAEIEKFALFENQGNATFRDATAGSGLSTVGTSTAVHQGFALGDYDGDGDLDVYVSNDGYNHLLRNDGNMSFTDVAKTAGVEGRYSWSVGSSWGDYDGDGDLDLYVGNYIKRPSVFPTHRGFANELYRNDGNGTFTEVTSSAGLTRAGSTPGTTLVTAFTDFDDDGDLDLMDCNDFGNQVISNQLYQNDGTGNFTEVSKQYGANVRLYCMGIAVGDFDRDLDLDYYYTSIGRSAFLENRGASGFREVVANFDVEIAQDDCIPTQKRANWGTAFFDFDHDGWEDLFVAGGWLRAHASLRNAFKTQNKLFLNRGPNQTFLDVSQSAEVASTKKARGVVFGDYDDDGDVDIFVINILGKAQLLRNDSPNLGAYLWVDLDGRVSNSLGLHAKVEAEAGNVTHLRELGNVPSYTCGAPPEAHFGLDKATQVDVLRVRWPSGIEQELVRVPVDQRVTLTEPYVVVDGVQTSGPVRVGNNLGVDVDVAEEAGQGATVDVELELLDASGGSVASTQKTGVQVKANATDRHSFSLAVPASATAGTHVLVVSVREGAALDEFERAVTVNP